MLTVSLSDLPHDEATARMRAAAAVLEDHGDPMVQAVGRELAGWVEGGATRRAWAEIMPPAPRGGDHGRGEALRAAIPVLRKVRREHFPGASNRQAAEYIRASIEEYAAAEYSKNRAIGKFPDSSTVEYWWHYFISSGALYRAGKLIEAETIARHLGEENSSQYAFQFEIEAQIDGAD